MFVFLGVVTVGGLLIFVGVFTKGLLDADKWHQAEMDKIRHRRCHGTNGYPACAYSYEELEKIQKHQNKVLRNGRSND